MVSGSSPSDGGFERQRSLSSKSNSERCCGSLGEGSGVDAIFRFVAKKPQDCSNCSRFGNHRTFGLEKTRDRAGEVFIFDYGPTFISDRYKEWLCRRSRAWSGRKASYLRRDQTKPMN